MVSDPNKTKYLMAGMCKPCWDGDCPNCLDGQLYEAETAYLCDCNHNHPTIDLNEVVRVL